MIRDLTETQRAMILAEAQSDPLASVFSPSEVNNALASALLLFEGLDFTIVPTMSHVALQGRGTLRPAEIVRDLIPAIGFAHRHFGPSLPRGLQQKLRAQHQTHDTLFELVCLGLFNAHHRVTYEPALDGRKRPDFMVQLPSGIQVYVECKCQSPIVSKADTQFQRASSRMSEALGQSRFIQEAWKAGLRTEIYFSRCPSDTDLRALRDALGKTEFPSTKQQLSIGESLRVTVVPRERPFDPRLPPPAAQIAVPTTPINVGHEAVHLAFYPWPGVDRRRRASQRQLLAEARRQLAEIPVGSFGMICVQVFSSRRFAPDIHKLIEGAAFQDVPIVWLNPLGSSRLITRDDAKGLRSELFGPMIASSEV